MHLFIRTTTSSIHSEAILVEVTMSMNKNTMVRGKKGKGGLKLWETELRVPLLQLALRTYAACCKVRIVPGP